MLVSGRGHGHAVALAHKYGWRSSDSSFYTLQIKQQLRERMHDPVPQTGQWLQSIVQGYFNYYAVPGNLKSLGVFRDRVLALWWRTIRRRSQKHRISWTRILVLAQRWLPQPRALHPFPDARFAATHPR